MDGYITIGTELDTNKFDRQITDLEKKIKHEENNKITIETKLSGQEKQLDEERKKVDALSDAYWRMKEAQDAIEKGIATPSQLTSFFEMKDNYGSLEQLESTFNKALDKQDKAQQKVDETKRKYEEVIGKVDEYKAKIESVSLQRQQYEIEQARAKMSGLSNSVQDVVHKVGKWALALFSVRSVYNIIRQSVSTLTQENQGLADQITAIKTALANALEPIIQFIVDVATKVVAVIGYILKLLFGIDIFAKKATNNVKKTTKAVKGLGGASADLKKQLAGFDEINMLNKDGSTGGLGGLGDDIDGVMDKMQDMSKLGEELWNNFKNWFFLPKGTNPIKTLLDGLGIIFDPVNRWINENFWTPFKSIFEPIDKFLKPAVDGIGNILGSLDSTMKPVLEDLKDGLGNIFKPWANDAIDAINAVFGPFGVHLDHIGEKADDMQRHFAGSFEELERNAKDYEDFMSESFDNIEDRSVETADGMRTHFAGSIEDIGLNEEELERLSGEIFGNIEKDSAIITGNIKQHFAGSLEGIELTAKDTEELLKGNFASIEEKASFEGQALGTDFLTPMQEVQYKANELSSETIDINTDTQSIIDISGELQGIFDQLVDLVKNPWSVTATLQANMGQSLKDIMNKIMGVFGSAGWMMPRMATGGIVNVPNRGTLVGGGSAIAGEAGAEGIVPLTDQQAMSTLGAEIGRNVLVNLTNITTMNGRVISRELKNIQSDQDFAYNM